MLIVGLTFYPTRNPCFLKVILVSRHKSKIDPDAIAERMREVRASALQDAAQLHDDAEQLVNWKAYARASPFVAIAVMSLIGFGAFRKLAAMGSSSSTRDMQGKQSVLSEMQATSNWRSSTTAILSEIIQTTVKKYLLNLVQHELFERTSRDQSTGSNSTAQHARQSATSNGETAPRA